MKEQTGGGEVNNGARVAVILISRQWYDRARTSRRTGQVVAILSGSCRTLPEPEDLLLGGTKKKDKERERERAYGGTLSIRRGMQRRREWSRRNEVVGGGGGGGERGDWDSV